MKSKAPTNGKVIDQAIRFYEQVTSFRFVERNHQEDFVSFTERSDADPADGDPICEGTFDSIGEHHQIIPIGTGDDDRPNVLVRGLADNVVRVFAVDVANRRNPLTDRLLTHEWKTISKDQEVTYVGFDFLLARRKEEQTFRLFRINRKARGDENVVFTKPVVTGGFDKIDEHHRLVRIAEGRVLDWRPESGAFRVLGIKKDPKGLLFTENLHFERQTFETIDGGSRLVSLSDKQLLDWRPDTSEARIWRVNLDSKVIPLANPPLWGGEWSWLDDTNVIVALDAGHILVWDPPSGDFSVRFIDLSSSHSDSIGNEGGEQIIFLRPDDSVGTVLHELGHMLGLHHEQERSDRDEHVEILSKNIADGFEGNFEKQDRDDIVMPTEYDFASIMHYGTRDFSVDGESQTLKTKPAIFEQVIKTGELPSEHDIETLNFIADPLPGVPLTQAEWQTIDDDHVLVAVGNEHVIDFVPETRAFRVWRFDRDARNHDNPLHPTVGGSRWEPNLDSDRVSTFVPLEDSHVMRWVPETGAFSIHKFHVPTHDGEDPLSGDSLGSGIWPHKGEDHHLVHLGGDRVLDWTDDGAFSVWPLRVDTVGPVPDQPTTSGTWETIDGDHELILLADGNVLDRKDDSYRIWEQNRDASHHDNPLGRLLASGKWDKIDDDHYLVPIGKDRVIDWEPDGDTSVARVWSYENRFGSYRTNPLLGPQWAGTRPELTHGGVVELDDGHILTWSTKTGDYQLWHLKTTPADGAEAFHSAPHQTGTFDIKGDNQIVNLGSGRLLDFNPSAGDDNVGRFRISEYDLGKKGPLLRNKVGRNDWFIGDGHVLLGLGVDHKTRRILDWVPHAKTGEYAVWNYDPKATGTSLPLYGPQSSGTWSTIHKGHQLVYVDSGHLIDWLVDAGYYRVYRVDASSAVSPIQLPMVVGIWKTVGPDHKMIGLSGGRVLEWETKHGHYRIWKFSPVSP